MSIKYLISRKVFVGHASTIDKFQKRVDLPHGFGDDPFTDGELEDKFREMATKYMGEEQIKKIFDAIWNVESVDDICNLMRLMVFQSQ